MKKLLSLFKCKHLNFCWFFIGLLFLSSVSNGQEFIAALGSWEPHIIFDQNGQSSGIDVEILNELARRAKIKLRYKHVPFKRIFKMLQSGKADIVCSVIRTPEREKYLHFIETPYLTDIPKVFYFKKGKREALQKYDDLHQLTVGVMGGYKYFSPFDQDSQIKKYPVNSHIQLFKMLASNRIDSFVETETVGDYLVLTQGFTGMFEKSLCTFKSKTPAYIAVSQKSPLAEQAAHLNVIMKQMIAKQKDEQIKDYFFNRLTLEKGVP